MRSREVVDVIVVVLKVGDTGAGVCVDGNDRSLFYLSIVNTV